MPQLIPALRRKGTPLRLGAQGLMSASAWLNRLFETGSDRGEPAARDLIAKL